MKSANEHLTKLQSLAKPLNIGNGAMTVGFMIPEFAALLNLWAERAERLQKWIMAFTVVLIIQTAALVWLTWCLAAHPS